MDLLLRVSCFFSAYILMFMCLILRACHRSVMRKHVVLTPVPFRPCGIDLDAQLLELRACVCAQKILWKTRRIFCSSRDTWSCWVTELKTVTSPLAWRRRGWRTGDSTRSHMCSSGVSENLFTRVFLPCDVFPRAFLLCRRLTPDFFQGCSVDETQLHSLQLHPIFTSQ